MFKCKEIFRNIFVLVLCITTIDDSVYCLLFSELTSKEYQALPGLLLISSQVTILGFKVKVIVLSKFKFQFILC